jgi:anti-sigma B factor antagonist
MASRARRHAAAGIWGAAKGGDNMQVDVLRRRTADGNVIEIALSGEVDLANADRLQDRILAAIDSSREADVVVDLARVTFLDSTGIAALLAGHHCAKERATDYRVVHARGMVHRTLDVAGVLAALSADG